MIPEVQNQPWFKPVEALPPVLLSRWIDGGMALLDGEGRVIELNHGLADWFQMPVAELIGSSFWELLRDRALEWPEEIDRLRASRQIFQEITFKLRCSATETPHYYRLACARHPQGAVLHLHSILPANETLAESAWDEYLRSPGAQRDLFARLLRAETQLQTLSRRWPGVIFTQRPDLTFHFITPKIVELTGVPVSDWQQNPNLFWQVVHESDLELLQQQLKASARSREGVTTTYRIRHLQSGHLNYILEYRQPILSANGLVLAYEGVWLDMTRQTIAEKRLSSAAWKETLALLTMGLAHDFTNIMAGIHSLSESFLCQLEPSHPFREGMALIKTNSLQASQLVHRIINLHRGKTGEKGYFNLNEIVTDLLDLIRKIVPRRIELRTELAQQTLPVFVDAVEFRQVIVNLALNAIDAMPQTGRLVLRTSSQKEPPPNSIQFYGLAPRFPAMRLSISDTGCGIKARHLANIFDPFFTTKAMNKGSGLGLYNARVFLETSNGAISVDTAEGAGTTFHLWFPEADFTEANPPSASPAKPAKRRSLLVAGNPGDTLEATAEFLRSHDFHVVTAISTQNALDLLRSAHYQFSGLMVVLEPNDPHATLFEQACALQPSLKKILKPIGHDRDQIPAELLGQVDLVISPDFDQSEIVERIRTVFEPTLNRQTS